MELSAARVDVAVIGAGAAGLTAARELRRRKYRATVFEARDRIGGRIHTLHDARLPIPIELGAEFIHGEAPHTTRVFEEAGLVALDLTGMRGLRAASAWSDVDRLLALIDPKLPDRSLAEFLAGRPGGRRLTKARELLLQFAQGFFAGDPGRMSVRSLAPENGESATSNVYRSARPLAGYGGVSHWLASGLGPSLRLSTPVESISWEPGRCEIVARTASRRSVRESARATLVTIPLSLLPGLRIDPDPPRIRQAASLLAMGSALRVTFWFRELPWKMDRLPFWQMKEGPFRVWWTAHPLRWPLAVAWCGGPPATSLSKGGKSRILDAAIGSLARSLGQSRRRIEGLVRATWIHDWDRDPYSRGAYSYVLVGGEDALTSLAKPVGGTLFFAGEHTDREGQYGTVEGAIASGLRAARQIDRALAKG